MVKVALNSEVANGTSNSTIAAAVVAGAVSAVATRFVWKRIKNRKA